MAGNKKQVKKNTKPIVVDIDDKPLLDTSNLDTAVQTSASTKKDGKKVTATTTTTTPTPTPTPTPTTTTTTEKRSKEIEIVPTPSNVPVIISASTSNVVIAPAVEAQITDDFSVVPEKNKNKKKINSTATDGTTTTNIPKPTPFKAPTTKKGNTAPRSQFHLLALDEDDITFDETHSHKAEPQQPQQQHSTKKSSSKQQATQNVSSSSKKSKSKETKKVEPTTTQRTTTTTTKSTPTPTPTPTPVATKVVEQPKEKSSPAPVKKEKETKTNKKESEGFLFSLMESLITPGVPSVVYKIIYVALIGVLLFSLVPLYYSGLDSIYSYGVIALVLGLGISLTLFISEIPRLQASKEQKSKSGNKKSTTRKVKA
ncbi:hypothetical protein ACTFIY_007920 [Dictyostelium cf. discoideum]